MSWPTPQTDNARNSLPSTNLGWFPGAPGNIGTPMNGQPMANPMAPTTPMTNVQYTDEDYSTHHNAVITGQLFLGSAVGPELARTTFYAPGGADPDAGIELKLQKLHEEFKAPLTDGQGVVANVGELVFSVTSEGGKAVKEDYDIVQHFAMPTSDENSVVTPALTVPQLNQYLKLFKGHKWSLEDVMKFADSIRFYGVVRAVGPGENQITENNVKNYVHVCERVALASDIWSTVGEDYSRGVSGTKRRPYGSRLFLELVGKQSRGYADVFEDLMLTPYHTMRDDDATERLLTQQNIGGGRMLHVLFHWFIGTFRSVQTARAIPGVRVDEYTSGGVALQQHLSVAEISVGL
jgi:hypothetical protein